MTHTHIETITFKIWYQSSHMCSHTYTHTHTHARTHFDIGTGTVGLPSLEGGGGIFVFVTLFSGGKGLRTALGGVELRGVGGCSFLCFTVAFCHTNLMKIQ